MAAAPSRSRGDYDHLIKLLLIGDSGACLSLPCPALLSSPSPAPRVRCAARTGSSEPVPRVTHCSPVLSAAGLNYFLPPSELCFFILYKLCLTVRLIKIYINNRLNIL
jgi:hypothetical protein